MKRVLFVCLLALGLPLSAYAYRNFGPYVGIQGGFVKFDEGQGLRDLARTIAGLTVIPTGFTTTSRSVGRKSTYGYFGGRGFIGWSFSPYISLEGGFSVFNPNKNRAHYIVTATSGSSTMSANVSINAKTEVQVWDLMAKLSLPLTVIRPSLRNWSIYGKFGIAYVDTRIYLNMASSVTPSAITNPVPYMPNGHTSDTFAPTYGAGVAYNFNPNFTVDLSWTGVYGSHPIKLVNNGGIFSLTNLNKVIPWSNMLAVGIIYKLTSLF